MALHNANRLLVMTTLASACSVPALQTGPTDVQRTGTFEKVLTYAVLSGLHEQSHFIRMDKVNPWFWKLDFEQLGDDDLARGLAARITRELPAPLSGGDTVKATRRYAIHLEAPVIHGDSARVRVVHETADAYQTTEDGPCSWYRSTVHTDYRLRQTDGVWEYLGRTELIVSEPGRGLPQTVLQCRRR